MSDAVKEALREAFIEIVLEQGFEGATTSRIAARAGVNEVTLFRHFGSKANLLQETLRAEADIFTHAAVHYTGDLDADLTALATAYIDLARQQSPLLLLAYFELARSPQKAELLTAQTAALTHVTSLFARYQQAGLLRAVPPQALMLRFIGPVVFAGLIQNLAPGFLTFFQSIRPEDLVRGFLDGHRQPLPAEEAPAPHPNKPSSEHS